MPEPMGRAQRRWRARSETPSSRFEVEQLTGKRWINGRVHYRVKWAGYPSEDATWEPATELRRSAARMVREFERRHAAEPPAPTRIPSLTKRTAASSRLRPTRRHRPWLRTSASQPDEDELQAFPPKFTW